MKRLKTNKGITLIALIITIIVLLILAIVSVKLIVDNGVVGRAESATNKYNTAQTNEIEQLDKVEEYMAKYENGNVNSEWWKLTDAEKEELKDHAMIDEYGELFGYELATAEIEGEVRPVISLYAIIEGELSPMIGGTCSCYYTMSDNIVRAVQAISKDITVQRNKWYEVYGENYDNIREITECPYSMSDFKEVYSRTYVERLLNSFK